MTPKRESLARNTVMLYLLTGSNYLFGLITIPYLTRVLGVEMYGAIGFATAYAAMVQMVLDFGFQLSATMDVANNQDDTVQVSRIVTAVTIAKLLLIVPTLIVVVALCIMVPQFANDTPLFALYFLYALVNALMPEYLYRGMESMTTITLRNVAVKGVFAICVFLFVHGPDDYLLVPIFYLAGSVSATIVVYHHMKHVLGIWFSRVNKSDVANQLHRSSLFFASRAAASVYTSLNTIVMGMLFPTGSAVAFYTACNSAINAGRQAITPITGSMFPHMVRSKDYRLLFRVLMVGELILFAICALIGVFAKPICELLFGADFASASTMLQIMLPLIPITLASYLFGWSGLGALGLDRITNHSVFFGAFFQLSAIAVISFMGVATPELVCMIVVVTEFVVLLIRAIAFMIGWKAERECNG